MLRLSVASGGWADADDVLVLFGASVVSECTCGGEVGGAGEADVDGTDDSNGGRGVALFGGGLSVYMRILIEYAVIIAGAVKKPSGRATAPVYRRSRTPNVRWWLFILVLPVFLLTL